MTVLIFPARVTHLAYYPVLCEYVLMSNTKRLFAYSVVLGVRAIGSADEVRLARHECTLQPIVGDCEAVLTDWQHRSETDPIWDLTPDLLARQFPIPRLS